MPPHPHPNTSSSPPLPHSLDMCSTIMTWWRTSFHFRHGYRHMHTVDLRLHIPIEILSVYFTNRGHALADTFKRLHAHLCTGVRNGFGNAGADLGMLRPSRSTRMTSSSMSGRSRLSYARTCRFRRKLSSESQAGQGDMRQHLQWHAKCTSILVWYSFLLPRRESCSDMRADSQ